MHSERIALIDDNEANRYAMSHLLRKAGFDVLEGESGSDARALSREHPDLMILDVRLPDVSGYDLAREFKGDPLLCAMPILQVSASFVSGAHRATGLDSGAEAYIAHPFEPVELLATVRALLRAKSLEDELRAKAAALERSNAELEEFAFVVSHDLQEPLRLVMGYAELLGRDAEERLGPEQQERITRILSVSQRMSGMIRSLLEYARIGADSTEPVAIDCNLVLRTVREGLAGLIEESGARIEAQELPRVLSHPGEVERLLLNLLSNSLKFRAEHPPQIELRSWREGPMHHFRLSDNGPGLAPGQESVIFRMFQRGASQVAGNGMGLAICRKIVERHGGRIWAEPNSGQGAVFHFLLPAAD